jgi:type IV secretory pathway TraG/TraD family ATPase VirD4
MTLETQKAHDADPGAWLGWVLGGIAAASWHLAVATAAGSSIGDLTQSLIAPIAYAFDDGMIDDVALPALPSVLTLWAVYAGAAVVLCIAVAIIIGRIRRPKRAGLSTAKELRAKNKKLPAAESRREPFAFIGGKGIRDRDEDTATMLAPTGMGKTTRGVVGAINRVGAGPCISTSTKPDVLRLTAGIRREFGAIRVYDPQGVSGWPNRTRWDICGGCERDQIAMERARALVAARPLEGDSKNSGFFANASETILRCMMHAAALEGLNMESVIAWTRDFQDDTPFTILRDHPNANPGWYDDLKKYSRGDSPETASNIEQTLSGILQAFSIREILDSVCPAPGEGFDVDTFHTSTDTLYLLTQSGGDALAAPVITALVEAIQQAAKRAATRTKEGRLTPILTNVLDEVPNICPIPSLPSLMSDGRGHGIKTIVVAQNRDQLVARFGEHGTNTIISNSSILLQLGGSRDTKHLRELSDLADQHLREQISTSVNGQGTSTSTSTTKDNVISIGEIAHLEEGQALLLYRELAPAIVTLPAWYETKDKAKYEASQRWVLQQEGFLPGEDAA